MLLCHGWKARRTKMHRNKKKKEREKKTLTVKSPSKPIAFTGSASWQKMQTLVQPHRIGTVHSGASTQSWYFIRHFWHVPPASGLISYCAAKLVARTSGRKQNITIELMPQSVCHFNLWSHPVLPHRPLSFLLRRDDCAKDMDKVQVWSSRFTLPAQPYLALFVRVFGYSLIKIIRFNLEANFLRICWKQGAEWGREAFTTDCRGRKKGTD